MEQEPLPQMRPGSQEERELGATPATEVGTQQPSEEELDALTNRRGQWDANKDGHSKLVVFAQGPDTPAAQVSAMLDVSDPIDTYTPAPGGGVAVTEQTIAALKIPKEREAGPEEDQGPELKRSCTEKTRGEAADADAQMAGGQSGTSASWIKDY